MGMIEIDIGRVAHSQWYLNDLFDRCMIKGILTEEGREELRKEL